jgi:hypothetical protein
MMFYRAFQKLSTVLKNQLYIVACLLGNATYNLSVLDLTLDLLEYSPGVITINYYNTFNLTVTITPRNSEQC